MFEKQFEEAIQYLKSKYNLPKTGFLAGGAIANTVWNLVSGKNSPINDIDIYRYKGTIPQHSFEGDKRQKFSKKETSIFEDYKGPYKGFKNNGCYVIEDVYNEGMLNFIDYISDVDNLQLILDSFDLNCCQIGYDLEKEKFYYTKEFVEFLQTSDLRLTNLTSPSHTAVRLFKKKDELGANLPQLEIDIISYSLGNGCERRFNDTSKVRFKERYANIFRKYESELSQHFIMLVDENIKDFLLSIGVDEKVYYLKPRRGFFVNHIFSDISLTSVSSWLSFNFIYYIRNIVNSTKTIGGYSYTDIWKNMSDLIDIGIDYFDTDLSKSDIDLLFRIVKYARLSSNQLKGLTLSKQWEIVSYLFEYFKDDPIVGISILEYCNVKNIELDSDSMLLLELSVRKLILEDKRTKVSNILNIPILIQ